MCTLGRESNFLKEAGSFDVFVNSPDCKILSPKFKKTISLNILKAKQNVTHLQGGPGRQATRMWLLPYDHACSSWDFYG
jgi:hypothetical protein